ncbi:MAG: TRAP transporter substrate-binding protein DctP, partial [Rhodospirillales bacterium]|nr:TRAP transporter substrate-binding protein DctP [Rhodospirillales bacterium]
MKSISKCALIAAVGMLPFAGAQPVQAQAAKVLKIAIFTPKPSSSSRWFLAKEKWIAKKSKGSLKLQLFFGSSMGPMPRHHDLARTGVADMSFFQQGVTRGRFPLTELFHTPYLFPPGAKGSITGSKVSAEVMDEYIRPEHEKVGTKVLWVVFNRPSGVYDAKKPIRTVADLKGRRYRAPTPTDVIMMKSLGALPIGMPATHMAESLQKGTIDGVVTDPMGIFAFRLGTLVKYYTNTFVSAISFGLALNPKSYDGLSKAHRALLDELGSKQAGPDMAALSWNDYPVYLKYMAGLKFETVTMKPGEEAKMRAAAAKVVEGRIQSMEKAGHPARKFYNK